MDHLEEFRIPKETLEKLKTPSYLQEEVEKGKSFQDIIGYTSETMDKFYGVAYNLFQQQKYEEASDAFIFLTTLNPRVHSYWLGLGMSEQLNHEYDNALMAYSMASLLDSQNPIPHYHSAACYHELKDSRSALASLEFAIQIAGDQSTYSNLKSAAKSALERLRKI